ncbi:hypothetical protein BaRGS_00027504 [Batillaria attramentaria]|uniref:Uncharacterized protein n=1 Tax=Batillaria attramentaria TaxID=370345 RepID=A0ABD0K2H3_9CAEN
MSDGASPATRYVTCVTDHVGNYGPRICKLVGQEIRTANALTAYSKTWADVLWERSKSVNCCELKPNSTELGVSCTEFCCHVSPQSRGQIRSAVRNKVSGATHYACVTSSLEVDDRQLSGE